MSVMLPVGLISVALSIFPLLAKCGPVHVENNLRISRRDEVIVTETAMSTFLETSTLTTYTTTYVTSPSTSATTTSASSISGVSSTSASPASAPTEAILFLPPGGLSSLVLGSGMPGQHALPASSHPGAPRRPQVMAYYPDWAGEEFQPEKIDFNRFDWIDFAFSVPSEDFSLGWDGSDEAPNLLSRLVAAAHAKGKKVKLSVGGWTGSRMFSTAMANARNRQTLASNILALYARFNLDGIDIDWEYPGQQGFGANAVSPSDTADFLVFLQVLRTTLPPGAKITAATMTVPFADARGNPTTDVSEFAKVLDWIVLMNYDTWGSSKPPGPNAPLNDGCHNSTQPDANALAAVKAWTAAGFPASQIVLGVPSYGYISRSSATSLRTRALPITGNPPRASRLGRRFDVKELTESSPLADAGEVGTGVLKSLVSTVSVKNDDGGTDNGQVQFRELVRQGVLQYTPRTASAPPTQVVFAGRVIENRFAGANGFTRRWDRCSNTPFLQSVKATQVVTYDDPQSMEVKAMFAMAAGLLGVNMFDVHGDTDTWDLTDAIRRGLAVK